ncbi:MAG: TIGR01459 family HAD-type hydrolase [Alphaproteobacteria bacterium]
MSFLIKYPQIASFPHLLSAYQAFIIDQFGVIHDGEKAFPHAVKILQQLQELGHRVVLLSNSSRCVANNAERLSRLGVEPCLYNGLVTSGEAVYQQLSQQPLEGEYYYCFSATGTNNLLAISNYKKTDHIETADFILLLDVHGGEEYLLFYQKKLQLALSKNLPLLCANPDKTAITGEKLVIGPGYIADMYEKMGGVVHWFGKPFPYVYELCKNLLGDIAAHQILCVGDSLEHDIAGAKAQGFHSLLIAGGIHRQIFTNQAGNIEISAPIIERLWKEKASLLAYHQAVPEWISVQLG